jgi:integrase
MLNKPKLPPIKGYFPAYLKRSGSLGATSERYATRFIASYGDQPVNWFTSHRIASMFDRSRAKPGTIRREITAIQALVNFAREAEDLPPLRVRKPPVAPPVSRFFSPKDKDTALKACEKVAPWFVPHMTFLFYTGARRSEMTRLRWSNVTLGPDGKPSMVEIVSHKGGRGRLHVRRIPLHPRLVEAMDDILPMHGEFHDYVFRSKTGRPFSNPNIVNVVVKEILSTCGLGHMTPHDMRRTFATEMLNAGVSDHRIADLLGHMDLRMLRTYAVVEDDLRVKAVGALT